MPGSTLNLLITRPLPAARSFVERLLKDVLDRVTLRFSPLMEIQSLADGIEFEDAKAIIFSSANGVAVASDHSDRRDLPVYCVGHRTTLAAIQAGWNAEFRGENADQLVASLQNSGTDGPLLHLSGEHTRGEIAERLTQAGHPTRRLPVYSQNLLSLDSDTQLLLRSGDAIIAPMFSPRTARHFVGQCPSDAKIHFVALSPSVAEPLSGLSNSTVLVSDSPDLDGISAATEICVNWLCRVESNQGAQ